MAKSTVHFSSFPRTAPPPEFVTSIVGVLQSHEREIATLSRLRTRCTGTRAFRFRMALP